MKPGRPSLFLHRKEKGSQVLTGMDGELGHVYYSLQHALGRGWGTTQILPGGPTQTAEDMSRDMRQIRNQPEGPSATSPSGLPHLPRQARWPTSHREGFLPSPCLTPPHPSTPLPSQILPEQGLLWQPSPKYSHPSAAEEAEEPNVTESNPGYCCLRLA